jgi:Na+/H+-dicarboxylate symporter
MLDMCRTTVNVWSDACGAAAVAASEGEAVHGPRPASPAGPEASAAPRR